MGQMLTSSNILIISFGWQQHLSWCETGRYQNSLLSGTFWRSISLSHYQHHDHWLIILINQLEPWPTSWSSTMLPWPPRFGAGRQCRQCQSKSDRASWNTTLGIESDTQMKHIASKHIENDKKTLFGNIDYWQMQHTSLKHTICNNEEQWFETHRIETNQVKNTVLPESL